MIVARPVDKGIWSMRVVYISQSAHRSQWQFKSPSLPPTGLDCVIINDPRASNSCGHESKTDHILKAAKRSSARLFSVETGQINPKLGQDIEKSAPSDASSRLVRILVTLRQLPFELVPLVDYAGWVACLYSSFLFFDLMLKIRRSRKKRRAQHETAKNHDTLILNFSEQY